MFCIGLTLDKRIINVKNISCSCAWHLASISCQCTIYVKILTEACHNLDEKSDKKDANHKKKLDFSATLTLVSSNRVAKRLSFIFLCGQVFFYLLSEYVCYHTCLPVSIVGLHGNHYKYKNYN